MDDMDKRIDGWSRLWYPERHKRFSVNLRTIAFGFLSVLAIVAVALLLVKAVTYDYCPLYYGISCLPH